MASMFQIYRTETKVHVVAEIEGLSAARLTMYVFKALGCKGGDEKGHNEDARRYPRATLIMQKYHPFNENHSGRSSCMPEADAQVLADACMCSIEELLRRAAEHWEAHDAEVQRKINGK